MTPTITFKVGDWVRFYSSGVLVISEVRYMHRDLLGKLRLSTDHGEIGSGEVIEQRQLAEYIKGDERE